MPELTDAQRRAEELHEEAVKKSDAGEDDAALALYLEALALDRARPVTLYNAGLIYKYRRDWEHSLRYNRLAFELRPFDEATNWNLAIAATGLKDWRSAREVWKRLGLKIEEGDEPITGNFGVTPVRLNGFDGNGAAVEVVWARRLSPVTARILNIPTPEAKFRYGDVVLHDGAGTGTRRDAQGREQPVFNAFELLEPSDFVTFEVHVEAPDEKALESLRQASEAAEVEFEDWSALHMLCRACSEGRAHEQHEHAQPAAAWESSRRIGMAAKDFAPVEAVLERWCADDPDWRGASIDQDV
jgi:tetratricopeptide (TPR) repeat protein